MRLRTHLLVLTAGTLLPMVVFGVAATALIANHERALFERGASERTLALLTAVDAELKGHVNSVLALATSRSLEVGDLAAFHDEAAREVRAQPGWRRVRLARPDGQRILDSGVPFGAKLPRTIDLESFDATLRSREPRIGSLHKDETGDLFTVRIPVLSEGEVSSVLSALIDPQAIVALLTRQRLPPDWVGAVLDGNSLIVARTVDPENTVGKPASQSLRDALERAPEGWFSGSTLEGTPVYTPYNQSPWSGWTVALGIPKAAVEAGARRSTWLLTIGILAAAGLAALLAATLGQRISRPISSLAATANAIRTGASIAPARVARVAEVHELSEAMVEAAREVREREEALRAADRAKDEFLAMLGHELRNPLGAISSAALLLRLGRSKEGSADQAVEIITRQIEHMTRLVDDLLDVSRVTTGRVKLSRQPLDLAAAVTSAMSSMRTAGELDRHDVRVETEPVWVKADAARIEQIVTNLLGNAVKFTPEGAGVVLRVERRDGDAVLEVIDQGAGLSPDLVPRVFDLFVQGEPSLDRGRGGLGIGLTMVKRLAELHGGTVSVASDGPGRGARFTVRLPAIDAPSDAPEDPAQDARELPRRAILLIEDNEDARRSLAAALELAGHAVSEAADGPAGIEAAAALRPDAAVVDIGLPALDGYEVARRIRAGPGGGALALIALTGYGQDGPRRRALAAGFDEYLTKPVSPTRLAEVIEAAIIARGNPSVESSAPSS